MVRQKLPPSTQYGEKDLRQSRRRKTYIGVVNVAGTYAATGSTTAVLNDENGNPVVLGFGEIIKGVTMYAAAAVSDTSSISISLGHTTGTTTEFLAAQAVATRLSASPSVYELTATASYATPYAVTGTGTVYYCQKNSASGTTTGGPVYFILETLDVLGKE